MKRRSFLASLLLALFCPWETAAKAGSFAGPVLLGHRGMMFLPGPFIYASYIPFYTTPTIGLADFIARKPKGIAAPPLMARRSALHEFVQRQQNSAERERRWNGRKVNPRFYRRSGMVAYRRGQWLLPT